MVQVGKPWESPGIKIHCEMDEEGVPHAVIRVNLHHRYPAPSKSGRSIPICTTGGTFKPGMALGVEHLVGHLVTINVNAWETIPPALRSEAALTQSEKERASRGRL